MTLKLSEPQRYCNLVELKTIIDKVVARIAQEDLDFQNLVFIGILNGGAAIADYMARQLSSLKKLNFPVAYVDISLYRDDMIDTESDPFARQVEIPFAVKGKHIILVDDVLFTGRTIRAALTSILSLGRPKLIRLAVVVDRGGRELPIHADFVGCEIEVDRKHGIRVRTSDQDPEKGIFIFKES